MRFVQNHVVPRLPLEDMLVLDCKRVRRHADIKREFVKPTLPEFLTPLRCPMVAQNAKSWQKLLKFHLPVEEHTCWYNDKMRAPDASVTCKVCEQRDGLNSFPA